MFELKRPLKEKPDKFPKFSSIKGVEGSLLMGSDICNIYNFLKANPRKAFVSRDVREALKLKQDDKHVGDSMRILSNKQFIFRFPILCRAIGMRGSYIYSFSERDAWQRFWKEVPQKILQILTEIYNSPRKIFNKQELIDKYELKYKDANNWLCLCFNRDWKKAFGEPLIMTKTVGQKFRTFFYKPSMDDFLFQKLYEQYYKEEILSEKHFMKINAMDFEKFCVWTFEEYMRLKGINIEFIRTDKEPLDYLGRVLISIDDTIVKPYAKDKMELCKFVVSCKNYRFDRPIGSGYVMGMSGCLREGITFHGEQIFSPRNAIGIIFCTRAYYSAYEMAGKLGIRIFDLDKLMRMHQAVADATGKTHPLFDKIRMKVDVHREKMKGVRYAVPTN